MGPKLLLLGAPGVGKSYYGKMMSAQYGVPFRSMGKVLAERMSEGVKTRMAQGQLAPAESVIEVFCSLKEEFANGFILDGFPRSAEQVSLFEAAIRREPTLSPHFALHLSLRRDLSVAKLLGRRECSVCHANWNVADIHEGDVEMPAILPPGGGHVCTCGTPFSTRPDDTPEIIESRLDSHQQRWEAMQVELRTLVPVLDYTLTNGAHIAWPKLKETIDAKCASA